LAEQFLRDTTLSSRAIAREIACGKSTIIRLARRKKIRRRVPGGRPIPPTKRAKIAQLISETTLSARAIARELGISPDTVNREKRRQGYVNHEPRGGRRRRRCSEGHLLSNNGTCPICEHESRLAEKRRLARQSLIPSSARQLYPDPLPAKFAIRP